MPLVSSAPHMERSKGAPRCSCSAHIAMILLLLPLCGCAATPPAARMSPREAALFELLQESRAELAFVRRQLRECEAGRAAGLRPAAAPLPSAPPCPPRGLALIAPHRRSTEAPGEAGSGGARGSNAASPPPSGYVIANSTGDLRRAVASAASSPVEIALWAGRRYALGGAALQVNGSVTLRCAGDCTEAAPVIDGGGCVGVRSAWSGQHGGVGERA